MKNFSSIQLVFLVILIYITGCGGEEWTVTAEIKINPTEDGNWKVIDIVEEGIRCNVIDISKLSAWNCIGDTILQYSAFLSKSTLQETTLKGGSGLGIQGIVLVALEAEYEVTEVEEIEKKMEIEVEAKPGSYVEYRVTWKEVWTDGYVVVENPQGLEAQIPYNIKYALSAAVYRRGSECGYELAVVNNGCKNGQTDGVLPCSTNPTPTN